MTGDDEAAHTAYLDEVGAIVKALGALGLEPVLVGGMALVILGSRRVTRDFDFVVTQPGDRLEDARASIHGTRLTGRQSRERTSNVHRQPPVRRSMRVFFE